MRHGILDAGRDSARRWGSGLTVMASEGPDPSRAKMPREDGMGRQALSGRGGWIKEEEGPCMTRRLGRRHISGHAMSAVQHSTLPARYAAVWEKGRAEPFWFSQEASLSRPWSASSSTL